MTTQNTLIDRTWMQFAIAEAKQAEMLQEIPVGAIAVLNNTIIGSGYNCPITTNDPTAHAEIMALRAAANTIGNYRLPGVTLYVTLEPCLMCLGAMLHARIARLVFGTYDTRGGGIISNILNCSDATHTTKLEVTSGVFPALSPDSLNLSNFNHQFQYQGGVMAIECRKLLIDFFKAKRT